MGKDDRVTDEKLMEEVKAGNPEIMDYLMGQYKSMGRKKARALDLLGGGNGDLI